tara:strand:+ start:3440 stop:4012 length:573 start_codon:yes stop_codon:yes gene_type:complete
MSNYFSYFPTIQHDLKDTNVKTELTNVLRRFKVRNKVKESASTYYEYTMQEGDRPDTIAAKYYGDENLAWLVLHYNNIIDPYFELPMYGHDFTKYIKTKYGSVTTANATIKYYYKILEEEKVLIDGTRIPRREVRIDLKTYNSLAGTPTLRRVQSAYEWEEELNDEKKKIKLLDKRFVNQLTRELATVLR